MTFSTPENLKLKNVKGFARERLHSAPDRLRKSKNENIDIRVREKILLETRQLSDLRLNQIQMDPTDEYTFDFAENPLGNFKCHICTKRFHHQEAIEAHYLIHSTTNLNEDPIDQVKCDICSKLCSSKLKLRVHKNKRHPKKSEVLALI